MPLPDEPALIVEYTDSLEGFKGWLVIDTLDHRLCAGGMRVQPGLSQDTVIRMARNMTLKMRIAGLRVDGAKAGVDYDHHGPGKQAAMTRFIHAISPYVRSCYSMGPDLNVDMAELERVAVELDIPSVKMAIAIAQAWEVPYFLDRYRLLNERVNTMTLGQIRAGYGVAVAVFAVLTLLGLSYQESSVAIQGFGAVGKAVAWEMWAKGVRVVALADENKCLFSAFGLDIEKLLTTPGTLLPFKDLGAGVWMEGREQIVGVPCDVLIPAAIENAVTGQNSSKVQARAVVPGANLAVTLKAEQDLYRRGIVVLPDFLAGCGGSLSMDGLFGPQEKPTPAVVLDHIRLRMSAMVARTLASSREKSITPTEAALAFCQDIVRPTSARPYGEPEKKIMNYEL